VEPLAVHVEELNQKIALENVGDGRNNSPNTGRLAGSLIQRIGSPHVRMNYDSRNPRSREISLRIMRAPDAFPRRASPPAPLHRIRRIPGSFLAFVRKIFQP